MGKFIKKYKEKKYLTQEEIEIMQLSLLALKDEVEKICINKNINNSDFNRLCEIGKTIAVYEKKLKSSLKYINGVNNGIKEF